MAETERDEAVTINLFGVLSVSYLITCGTAYCLVRSDLQN